MLCHAIDGWQLKLRQAPIGDVADVGFDIFWNHALDRAHFESKIDELVFELHDRFAAIDDIVLHRRRQFAGFTGIGVEQFDHAFAMQAFITNRPGNDLAHALHLVEAGEVHQHGKRGK